MFLEFLRRYALVLAVAGVCVGMSVLVYQSFRKAAHQEELRVAGEQADARYQELMGNFESYERALNYMRGYFLGSDFVSRDEWRRFVEGTGMESQFPGVWGFGYVQRVDRQDLSAFVEEVRAQGGVDFSIQSHKGYEAVENTASSYVIKYLEPVDRNRAALGLDVSLNPANRDVYDRATDSGAAQLSSPFELKQQEITGTESARGLVMALADYKAGMPISTVQERRLAVRGWAVITLDMNYYAKIAMGTKGDTERLSMSIIGYDGVPVGLFDEINEESAPLCVDCGVIHSGFQRSYTQMVGGRLMDTEIVMDPSYAKDSLTLAEFHDNMRRADVSLYVGIKVTLLMVGLMLIVTYGRSRAMKLAGKMTESLRRSERRQREFAYHAQRANRAKSNFLANMSHEIRTPMTAVLGYTEMLAEMSSEHKNPEAMGQAVDRIARAGSHLLTVINDVLDLSKIESGRLTINPVPCRVGEVLAEVVDTMSIRANACNLELGVEFVSPVPGRIVTDPYRLRQILLNLVSNAIKFTREGSVRILVGVETGIQGDSLAITVKDTGIGVRPERLEHLFHPYEQEESVREDDQPGTGLGLSISRRLAEMMGGGLSVTSVYGEGSEFVCRLPLRLPNEHRDGIEMIQQLPSQHDDGAESSGELLQKIEGRVLIAEDGEDNQRLLRHFLGRAGLDIEFVWDGQQLLDRLAEDHAYDLIILDMEMPVLDGYKAATELRARGCKTPMMALTANALSGDRQRCLECGCDEYETKPINRARLLRTIVRMLGGWEVREHNHAA